MRKRKLKKVQQSQIRSCDRNDPLVQNIIANLEAKMNPKQISNILKVDIAFVHGIKNKFCKTSELKNKKEVDTIVETTEDVANTKEIATIVKEEKDMVISQDKVESYAIMYMDGKSITDISKETGDNEDDIFDALHEYHKQDDSFIINDVLKPSLYHKYKAGNHLTTAGKEYIMERIDNGDKLTDIAKDLHISTRTIYYMINEDKKKKIKEAKTMKKDPEFKEEVKPIEEKKEELSYTTIYSNKPKLVGLIDSRHEEIPINEFIFSEVSSNLMFDYAKQELLCKEYIENIKKQGFQSLEVFITGLGCITASLTKVALELNFPLTLKHYDKKTDSYKDQIIIPSENGGNSDKKFDNLLAICGGKINLINDVSETLSTDYQYMVELSDDTRFNVWLCKNKQTIITMIEDWIKSSLKRDKETSANVYKIAINDIGSYHIKKQLL